MDTVKAKDFKSPPNHMQTLIDGVGLFNYPYFPAGDDLKDGIQGIYDQVLFYGNRILKDKKELDSKWFNSYKDLCGAILAFVQERHESLSEWSGKEPASGSEAYFKSISDAAISGKAP